MTDPCPPRPAPVRTAPRLGSRQVPRRVVGTGVAAILAALALVGCGTLTSTAPVAVEPGASWVLLPIDNLSTTPLAGRAAAALVETRLRARGVHRVTHLEGEDRGTLVDLLEGRTSREEELRRARERSARYAVGGTVHEWHYKGAPTREPVVAVSLTLVEVATGRVLWQGSAARNGGVEGSITSLADRVIGELLAQVRVRLDDAST